MDITLQSYSRNIEINLRIKLIAMIPLQLALITYWKNYYNSKIICMDIIICSKLIMDSIEDILNKLKYFQYYLIISGGIK